MATVLGTLLGIGRFSPNALVRGMCSAYVELFRNVPVLLQLLMWYLIFTEYLPLPNEALSIGHGVNFTAGLPIVRTSPDHGTGLDIAGKGVADEGSFRNAVWMATDILRQRELFKAIGVNPLQKQERGKKEKD